MFFNPSSFVAVVGSGMDKNQDLRSGTNIPVQQTLDLWHWSPCWKVLVSMVEGDKDVLQQGGQTTILLEEAVDTVIIESQVNVIWVRTMVACPHLEPAFHFNADPDQVFSLSADPDPDPAPH